MWFQLEMLTEAILCIVQAACVAFQVSPSGPPPPPWDPLASCATASSRKQQLDLAALCNGCQLLCSVHGGCSHEIALVLCCCAAVRSLGGWVQIVRVRKDPEAHYISLTMLSVQIFVYAFYWIRSSVLPS